VSGGAITVRVRTVDHFRKSRTFKTLAGAQKFAQRYVGETPELGSHYAVSADGVATVYASVPVAELFPKLEADTPREYRAEVFVPGTCEE
jgi:hypothetical protein